VLGVVKVPGTPQPRAALVLDATVAHPQGGTPGEISHWYSLGRTLTRCAGRLGPAVVCRTGRRPGTPTAAHVQGDLRAANELLRPGSLVSRAPQPADRGRIVAATGAVFVFTDVRSDRTTGVIQHLGDAADAAAYATACTLAGCYASQRLLMPQLPP